MVRGPQECAGKTRRKLSSPRRNPAFLAAVSLKPLYRRVTLAARTHGRNREVLVRVSFWDCGYGPARSEGYSDHLYCLRTARTAVRLATGAEGVPARVGKRSHLPAPKRPDHQAWSSRRDRCEHFCCRIDRACVRSRHGRKLAILGTDTVGHRAF